jgi:hypothetical protein
MNKAIAKTGRPNFGFEETERGLLELVMANGNAEQAVRALAADDEAGFAVSPVTLLRWRKKEPDRYQTIRAEQLPQLMAVNAEHHLRVAKAATDTVAKLIARTEATIDELPPRDLSGAARNMATVAGIHADKATAAGEVPFTRQLRDAAEVLRDLEAMGYKPEVEQVVEAVVVEELTK